jgi:hypothetical protein
MSRSKKLKKPKSPAIIAKLVEEKKRRLAKLEVQEKAPARTDLLGMTTALRFAGVDPSYAGFIEAFALGLRLATNTKM